jgi:hypothetical protein
MALSAAPFSDWSAAAEDRVRMAAGVTPGFRTKIRVNEVEQDAIVTP